MLVGNVISVASLSTRFTTGSTGLYAQFFASLLESWETFLGPSGEVNVDGCSHASSKIGWARVNITELLGQLEVLAGFSLNGVLYSLNTSGQSFENTLDITSLLHGNDSELILLINPDKECFGFVVEDSTAFWPVTLHTSYLQVWITRHEEEVIINQLLSDSLIHSSQGIVVAREITSEFCESSNHEFFHVNTLLLGDSRGQTESLDGSSNTNSDGVNWDIIGNVYLILSTSMSETCLNPAGRPWYSQMSGSKISAKSMYESSSPAYIPQCWLSNSTAQAIALANVNPEVAVTIPLNLSHLSLVTCLATKECLDLMLGNSAILTRPTFCINSAIVSAWIAIAFAWSLMVL